MASSRHENNRDHKVLMPQGEGREVMAVADYDTAPKARETPARPHGKGQLCFHAGPTRIVTHVRSPLWHPRS